MADIFLSPIFQVILDKLATPVLEKFGNMWDLKENIQKLQRTLPMVQALLEDAEDQQATNTTVRIWLSKLKDVASHAEDLLMDFTIGDPRVYTRHASEVTKILKVLETTIDEGFRLNLREGSMVHREWDGRETSSFVVESEVYGREEDKENIVELLLSCKATQVGKASSISIVGMGGIGKTTLAQLVYRDERVTQHFDLKVWVFVSNQFDVKNIIVAVIESVTKEKCHILNMDSLYSAVWSLLHRKRYLIVLDDVWIEKPDDLDKLKPLVRGGIDGSKILITTRSRKVAFMLESPSFSCQLNGLPEDACWSLFMQRAFQQGEEELHPALLPIGQQIVRKCGGLPLAAKALGSLMRFKREVREWLFVRDSELWNLDECESGILSALRLSYFHLPPHLKRCLVFCSIFPRHYEIKKHKLIQLWMAEGLVQSSSGKPPEDIGNDYFNNLLWMSFFIEIKRSDNGVVMGHKMHDVIYDFVQSVAGVEYAILDCQLLAPRSFRQIRHSSVVCNFKSSVIPKELCDAKHLRTLLLFSGGTFEELPHEWYSNFKYLLVLDLCGSNLVDIDASIGHVSCLRFLDLSYTPIKRLPHVIEDLSLQTLNLFNCYDLVALPNLAKMRNLRHLNNNGCEALTGMLYSLQTRDQHMAVYSTSVDEFRQMVEMLTSQYGSFAGQYELQTLPLFVTGGPVDFKFLGKLNLQGSLKITHLENVRSVEEARNAGLRSKEGIESLGLYWGHDDGSLDINVMEEYAMNRSKRTRPSQSSRAPQSTDPDALFEEEILENLQPHQNLKRLLIKGYRGIRFPHWSIPYLVSIDLIDCRKSEHLPTLGNLRFLNRLSLRSMHGVRCIGREFYGEGNEKPFPALKGLVLNDLPNLEHWFGPDGGEVFPSLSKLLINKCPKLSMMPQILSIQHLLLQDCNASLVHQFRDLTSLRSLVIEKVSDLSYFSGAFPANNPLLKSLAIKSCPRLPSLPQELGSLTALKSLTIRWCEVLGSLPLSFQSLNALESLEIGDCHGLMSLPEGGTSGLSNLRSLSIENCNNLTSLSMDFQYLTCLESLTIMYCPGIIMLPQGVENLSALRSLTILSCPQLMCLPGELQNLRELHSLEIRSCPGLEVLPEWIGNLVSLRSLAISDLPNIRLLPEGMKSLTALQHLSIQDCPQLLERCQEQGGEDWPKIAHIPYKRIGSPEQANPSGAGSSSSN